MRKISALALCLLPSLCLADWQLDNNASSLHFLSTKNNLVTETHHFKHLEGSISDSGELQVTIDLGSLETNIPIRNERMQEHLFKLFPKALFKASLPQEVMSLGAGDAKVLELHGALTLNTHTQTVPMQLQVTKLADGSFQATTIQPIVLNTIQFSLSDGIQKLQEIAGLSSIDRMVPVTFNVRFK
ncbi:YceI family protein [Aliiglaciecola sp. CAU 1673]|uniref:YceI family protein n=1 Tax=Aliiglaciecola sp. CAU 1673 TaxID=3032595 RepID=UPI0023DA81E0|nr:YceI family protein [Aliiglaciecola sp. CAU 1673]MDF2179229.1 YceI family protein [Aliiglaciecola sp. CAU 1673]